MYKKEPISQYPEYKVDTNGIVYSKTNRPLKPSTNSKGYQIVNLMIQKQRIGVAVHTLVAKQFIPNADINKNQVNHIDGDKTNNNVSNLEWVTPLENTKHAKNVLHFDNAGENNPNAIAVNCYDAQTMNLIKQYPSIADAAKDIAKAQQNFRYVQNHICKTINHGNGKYLNYYWERADVME